MPCVLPDDWFEEFVGNTYEVGGVNNETGFQVFLVPSVQELVKDCMFNNSNEDLILYRESTARVGVV